MLPIVQKFIEDHIELIDNNQFLDLYHSNELNLLSEIGALTATLIHCGIDILSHTDGEVPEGFLSKTSIQGFEIPNGIITIEHAAFRGCRELLEIIFPSSLQNIGSSTFDNCINLHTIKWNAIKLQTCESNAFNKCYSLRKIIFSSTMDDWWALNDRCKISFPSGSIPEIECIDGIINERP